MAKTFSWSYTKLKNYETCPKRHWEIDLTKNIAEPESDQLRYGNTVHKVMDMRLARGTQLPPLMAQFEPWAQKFEAVSRQLNAPVKAEQSLAITKDFQPCGGREWDRAWYRAKIDVSVIGNGMAVIGDWKTGKIVDDPQQLALNAQCIFAHYPDVQWVTSIYVWLSDNCESVEHFTRASDGVTQILGRVTEYKSMATMWSAIWPRVMQLQHAWDTQQYPPNPSGLCRRHCSVVSCPYHGKGSASW